MGPSRVLPGGGGGFFGPREEGVGTIAVEITLSMFIHVKLESYRRMPFTAVPSNASLRKTILFRVQVL